MHSLWVLLYWCCILHAFTFVVCVTESEVSESTTPPSFYEESSSDYTSDAKEVCEFASEIDTVDHLPQKSAINCQGKPCVRKCCGKGFLFDLQSNCPKGCANASSYNDTTNVNAWHPLQVANVLYGFPNLSGNCFFQEEKEFYLQEDGRIFDILRGEAFSVQFYCIDNNHNSDGKISGMSVICYEPIEVSEFNEIANKIHFAGLAVSTASLMTILLLHLLSKEKKNLQTKCMISSCISLILSFILLMVNMSSVVKELSGIWCVALAIGIQYFTLAFYFWLNVMCYEITRIVRGTIKAVPLSKLKKANRYLLYFFYSLGIPLAISAVTYGMQYLPKDIPSAIEPYIIRPAIDDGRCWFKEEAGIIFVYYYGIEIFLHLVNTLLMGHTAFLLKQDQIKSWCCKKSSLPQLQIHSNCNHVAMFWQQLYIFMLYVFIWGLNCVTLIYSKEDFWRIIDIAVAFQGLFLFIIVATSKKFALMTEAYRSISDLVFKTFHKRLGRREERKVSVDQLSQNTEATYL